jgi:hypothetical protein
MFRHVRWESFRLNRWFDATSETVFSVLLSSHITSILFAIYSCFTVTLHYDRCVSRLLLAIDEDKDSNPCWPSHSLFTSEHTLQFRLLAKEVLGTQTNHDDRSILIGLINRLSGVIGDRRKCLFLLFPVFGITSEDLLERILIALSSSNVAQFIDQLHVADRNMDVDAARPSLASSELSAGGRSGSARVQGTPSWRPSTSSGESASDAAVAVTRGPDPTMARRFQVGPGDNTQDANAVKPILPIPVAILDLEAAGAGAGAADADRTQTRAVIDGAATVTDAAAAAKSESDDDSAPADSRKRKRQQLDADDDCKPPAKWS